MAMRFKSKRYDDFIPKKTVYHASIGDRIISVVTYLVYAIFSFVCVYPFYYIFINTISNNDMSKKGKVIFLPHEIHFHNYAQVLKLEGIGRSLWISVSRTVVGTAVTLLVAAFLGFMFTRESLWHKKLWSRLVVATMYFNAGIIPTYITYMNLGLLNNFWVYIFPVAVQPFYIILCKTYVESVPKELQDAAEIDGAGTLLLFFKIILPVIKPILATIAIFSAVAQWNSFQDTLLYVTDKKLYPMQYLLYTYMNSASSIKALISSNMTPDAILQSIAHQQNEVSVRMTVTMVVVAPIMMVYPFFQRYFTKGIMVGAVKG